MTAVLTTSPSTTLMTRERIASTARKPSATLIRLLAESSSVRSNHWVEAVIAGLRESAMTYRARAAIRSLRIGLRLYAIAEEPIWCFSNGSSISLRCWSSRISLENFAALCAMPERVERIIESSLRG